MGNSWTSFIHYLSQVFCLDHIGIYIQGLKVLRDAAAAIGQLNQWSRICSYWASTEWKGKKKIFLLNSLKITEAVCSQLMIYVIVWVFGGECVVFGGFFCIRFFAGILHHLFLPIVVLSPTFWLFRKPVPIVGKYWLNLFTEVPCWGKA